MRTTTLFIGISLILAALVVAMAGCGGNASSTFSSKWTIEISELLGGKKTVHYIDLLVKGDRFFMHRKEPADLASMGFDGEGTIIQECDVVFDGKTLWEFNRKASSDSKEASEYITDWNKEEQNNVLKLEPDDTTLDMIRFWKIPKGLPTEQTAKDRILGRDVTVLTSRQRSTLGADLVLTFWVDPAQKVLLKRQDSTGGESQGKGTSDSVFGRQYTCTEFITSPVFPKDRFIFKAGPSQKVEILSSYPFTI